MNICYGPEMLTVTPFNINTPFIERKKKHMETKKNAI